MRKLTLILFVSLISAFSLVAQTKIKGVVKDATTGNPLPGANVTLLQQNITTQTNSEGQFTLSYINAGNDELSISRPGYFTQIKSITIKSDVTTDFGVFSLKIDVQTESKEDVVVQLSETELNGDDGQTQNNAANLSSKGDVYANQASFSFSPMRFSLRGYDQRYESTYINGVQFNGLERGNFNYSSLGGLNDAFRNQEEVYGTMANSFSYGDLAGVTNINARASTYAAQTKGSLAFSNRSYKLRAQITRGTGILSNGWAFAGSAVVRWADEGIMEGTFYNSAGYFLSAEKVFNKKHSLSIVTFGAPTKRGQSSASTQEVYDLANSIYYNSYWGYQDGKKRNSRIARSYDPTVIVSHDFNINDKSRLRSGASFHYSMYSTTALTFYNAPDPRPDYYRNMPSFATNATDVAKLEDLWKNDTKTSQLDWERFYQANRDNNIEDPTGTAKYAVERRHNNLMELSLNSTYINQISKKLKLTAGFDARKSKGMHYKTMDDLLGGNQWIDKDQFAERDFPTNSDIIQNDLNHPNRVIHEGDKFGYNYDLNISYANLFIQNEWNFRQLDVYYAGKVTFTDFYRNGHMRNGVAESVGALSYGKGKVWYSTDPSFKAGFTYKINGRNRISVNALAETRAPQVDNSYVSVRIKDTAVPMKSENILTADLNYNFNFPWIYGRVSAFRTQMSNSSDLYGYYDDEKQTFVDFMLSDMKKVYQGVEAGFSIKLNTALTFSMAGTYADYHYDSNANGIISAENGSFPDVVDKVMIKDLKIANGPQLAANASLHMFYKLWFADATLNYFDNNYLDFAPSRFRETNIALYTTDEIKKTLGTQEKLEGGFLLDASVGRLVYLPNRSSLNFNLSVSNVLDNRNLITGGYQQARLPLNNGAINTAGLNWFSNKYYYAWGINVFMTVGYKF